MKRSFYVIGIIIILSLSCAKTENDALLPFSVDHITDKEDNDLKKSPNEVITQNPIIGFFNNKDNVGDKDYYQVFFSHKDTSYKIVQTAVPGIDTKLTFYSPNGQRLFFVDEGKIGEAEKLWEYYPKTDYFIMLVEAKTGHNEKVPYIINFIPKKSDGINEIEPNNTKENAVLIKINDEKKGLISPKNDTDYYRLVFDDDTYYDFTIGIETLSNLDINFTIYNSVSDKIKFVNSFSRGQKEVYPFLSTEKGDYYIKVSGNIENNSRKNPIYYLTITENKPKDDIDMFYEREYNDEATSATKLIDATDFIGVFYPKNDDDWYEFDLFKKAKSVNCSLSRVRGIDPVMYLYNADMELIKTINDNEMDGPEQFMEKDLAKGRYYLKLSSEHKSLLEYKLFLDIRYK